MEGNTNNNLVVGSDGAIYCMVKPPVYDVDNRTVDQGNFRANPPMPGHPQMAQARARNLGLSVNHHPSMGAQTFLASSLNSSLNSGNIRSYHHPSMAPFPGMGDGSVMQNGQQMGFVPDMSLSSLGAYNHHHHPSGNGIMISNNPNAHGGLPPGAFHANANIMNPSVVNQEDLANRTRRRQDEEALLDGPSKRIRLVPLQGAQAMAQANLVRRNITGRCFSLYIESDERNLSHYQCLARKQIEIFESTSDDANTNAQGRNRPILPGQVGIRCRHCAKAPPKQRKTGSVYYPNRLDGVYQTAQKMTVGHLCKHCTMIPDEVRQKLVFLKDQKSSDGGGKRYWADGVRSLGVIETPKDGLTFTG